MKMDRRHSAILKIDNSEMKEIPLEEQDAEEFA